MESSKIRIYSANKAAFISLYVKPIRASKDEGNDKAYVEFPMSAEVQELLKEYYEPDTQISRFIRSYAGIRQMMKSVN